MQEGFSLKRVRQGRDKRARNREATAKLLRTEGIPFVSRQFGDGHLIVAGAWSLWPGTGLWREHGGQKREGRGALNLLTIIKRESVAHSVA